MFQFRVARNQIGIVRYFLLVVLMVGLLAQAQSVLAALLTNRVADLTVPGTAELGSSVFIRGDWAVVGAPATNNGRGKAYLFKFTGGNTWTLEKTFDDPHPEIKEHFGNAVAIYIDPLNPQDSTVVIAAKDEVISGHAKAAGAVFVFRRGQGGLDQWGLAETLQTDPPTEKGDRFGSAVVVWKDTLVVGAPFEDTDPNVPRKSGSVYIFTRQENGNWVQTAKMNGTELNDRFGASVAINGLTLVVGATQNTSNNGLIGGAAYVYEQNQDGTWPTAATAMLYATNPVVGDNFGSAVTISSNTQNTIVVGAPGTTTSATGSAFLFERVQGTSNWTLVKQFRGINNTLFGSAVAQDGDVVAVGAPNEDSSKGAFYVFARNEGGLENWGSTGKQVLSGAVSDNLFGSALSMQNRLLLVGAPGRNAGYIYEIGFTLEIDLNGPEDGFDYAATFTEGNSPVSIVDSTNLVLSELNVNELKSAQVTLQNPVDGSAEMLSVVQNGATIINQSWISYSNGVLNIKSPVSGVKAPIDDFRKVLASVRYENTSENPTEGVREVDFVAFDGVQQSNQATALVTVTPINDPPQVAAPVEVNGMEDEAINFASSIMISDVDGTAGEVALTVTHGVFSLNDTTNLVFSAGDGLADASMTFTGNLVDINMAFNGATFQPVGDYNGAASLDITVNDLGDNGSGGSLSDTKKVTLSIAAVNDAPKLTAPSTESMARDNQLTFSGNVSVSDVDADTLQVTLETIKGMVSLSGVSGLTFSIGDGTADSNMILTGSLANINAALDGMTFQPEAFFVGEASLAITADDLGETGTGGALNSSKTITITVSNQTHESVTEFEIPGPQPLLMNVWYDILFHVNAKDGYPTLPTGTVTVVVGNKVSTCQGELVNGEGSCKLLIPVNAVHSITVSYTGDGIYTPSSAVRAYGVDKQKIYLPIVVR